MRQSSAGTYMTGSISRFFALLLLPVAIPVGEPAEESMKPNSELFQHLRSASGPTEPRSRYGPIQAITIGFER